MAIKIAILISIVFLVRLIRSGNNIMSLELEPKEAMGYLISNKDLNLTCRCVNCTENTFLSVLATRKNEEHKFAINYDRNLLYVENVNFTDARVVVINSSYDVNKKTKTIKATFRIISTQVVSMDLTCNAAAFAQTNVTVGEYSAGLPPPITGPYFDVIRQIVSIRCEANGETYPPFREFAWRAISFDFENLDLSQLKVQNTHNSSTIFIPSQDPYFGGNYFCKARAKNAFNISEWSKEGRQHYRVNLWPKPIFENIVNNTITLFSTEKIPLRCVDKDKDTKYSRDDAGEITFNETLHNLKLRLVGRNGVNITSITESSYKHANITCTVNKIGMVSAAYVFITVIPKPEISARDYRLRINSSEVIKCNSTQNVSKLEIEIIDLQIHQVGYNTTSVHTSVSADRIPRGGVMYKCRATYGILQTKLEKSHFIHVLKIPKISLSICDIPAENSGELQLPSWNRCEVKCTLEEGYPLPNMTIAFGGKRETIENGKFQRRLLKQPSNYHCIAVNSIGRAWLQQNVRIDTAMENRDSRTKEILSLPVSYTFTCPIDSIAEVLHVDWYFPNGTKSRNQYFKDSNQTITVENPEQGFYQCKYKLRYSDNSVSNWANMFNLVFPFAKFKDVTREVFPIDGMSTFRCTLHSYPNITKSIDWVDKWDSPVQNRSNFKPFILSSISIDKYLYSTTFALRVVNATSRDYGRYFCRLTDFTQFKIIAASDYIRFNYTFIPDPPSNVLINKTASRITWTQSYFPNNEGYYKLAFRNPNGKVLDFKMTSAKIYKKGAYFNIDGNQSFVSIRSCNEFGCSRLVYEEQKPDEGSDPAVQIDNPTRGDNLLSWIMCIIGIGFMIIFIFVAFLLICNKRICCKGKHSNVKDGKTYYAAASEQPFRDFPTYKDQMRYNGRPESFFQEKPEHPFTAVSCITMQRPIFVSLPVLCASLNSQRIPLAHIDDDDSSSYRGERRISSS